MATSAAGPTDTSGCASLPDPMLEAPATHTPVSCSHLITALNNTPRTRGPGGVAGEGAAVDANGNVYAAEGPGSTSAASAEDARTIGAVGESGAGGLRFCQGSICIVRVYSTRARVDHSRARLTARRTGARPTGSEWRYWPKMRNGTWYSQLAQTKRHGTLVEGSGCLIRCRI